MSSFIYHLHQPLLTLLQTPQVFAPLHKLASVQLYKPSTIAPKQFFLSALDRGSGVARLALFRFFLTHAETVAYDAAPLLRDFLEGFVAQLYDDSVVAYETLNLCASHKLALLSTTNIFSSHFPPLMKIFAWWPEYLTYELFSLASSSTVGK